ncbi:SDR family oxidoreductase [Megasphaera hominis]|jgi:2-deoxy-D-gluconate 3-dehydrogenase|uniref:SDR family oxidoreductase n=1 Tax=Megasphaera hominis TaxID=159836 RepID=A0ABR6VHV2_9FIRM|nr:SDR family oxidoreductase [Megasphaera hominis]MBC3536825.1 SDR family oxidoreductase [Megasphaera hominis]
MDLSNFSLEGKLALVTGGSRGLGQAMAVALARAGADIISIQRKNECAETKRRVEAWGRKCYPYGLDLATLNSAEELAETLENTYGPVDILVNNAGIQRRHPCTEFPIEDWDLMLQVHLRATFLMCQAFGKRMIARGGGKIINVASLLAFSGGYTIPAYAAAKGGIAQLTKALANEWAEKNVNVNAIEPGYFDTDMNTALQQNPVRNSQILDRIPAKRYGDPDEIGGMTVFLASPAASYVHGSVMIVDGGWMAR